VACAIALCWTLVQYECWYHTQMGVNVLLSVLRSFFFFPPIPSRAGDEAPVFSPLARIAQENRRLPNFGEIDLTSSPETRRRLFSWPIRASSFPLILTREFRTS